MSLDPTIVDRVVAEATKRQANLDYFFDRLESADWITPLAERGLFAEPPIQLIDEEGYVRAPSWSASRFLARVAPQSPAAVLGVIQTISSDNERVHEDFEDAALVMPLEEAAKVADLECEWISSRDRVYYQLPAKTILLIERLAREGDVTRALALLGALFQPLPDTREGEWHLPHAQSRFSDWEYDHLLRQVSEALVPIAPLETVAILADLLEVAMTTVSEGDREASRLWRPRIADDRHRALDVEDALLSAVRDAAVLVRELNLLSDHDLAGLLLDRPRDVFQRVVMHVLAGEPDPDASIARRLMADIDALAHYEPPVEYRDLLQAHASLLEPNDVSALLAAIDAGPDIERYRALQEKFGGRAATQEEEETYVARWKVGRLSLLRDVLTPPWDQKYRDLVQLVGDAEIPVSGEVTTTFVGPTSPANIEDMEAMRDDELVDYLREWKSEGRWNGPSEEGLARSFSALAEANPERVSSVAPQLRDVRPAYIQWALHGLEQAVRQGRTFTWAPVLDLLDWVSAQPREREGGRGDDYDYLDPGWVWTRRAIAALLEAGLGAAPGVAIPYEERERVWTIIERIAADPDPTPEDEDRYGGHNMDPVTLALNTTRPRAVAAAIAYAVWTYKTLHPGDAQPTDPFFDEIPEVSTLLTQHLDPRRDLSSAVRAVVGQHFANLFALDNSWAAEHSEDVFPYEDTPLREAAWGAYVIYTRAYNDVLTVLRSHYLRAAELAGSAADRFRWMNGSPHTKLGEHLAAFYLRGVIGEQDDLLSTYWGAADDTAKEGVIEFIGRSLREAQPSSQVVERAQAFFDWVTEQGVAGLAAFSWWVPARDIPAEWRLSRLELLAKRKVKPAPAFLVVEELPYLAQTDPLRSIHLLRWLLEQDRARWGIDSWHDRIVVVLRAGLESADPAAQEAADETLNWLGALGYREFRSLAQHLPLE